MIFSWLENHKRKKILEAPFPVEWENILSSKLKHYKRLPADQQKHLRDLVQVFVAEKYWEGCGGLELTDEMKLTIAGAACLLVLGLPHDLFSDVKSILVYPTTMRLPERPLSIHSTAAPPQGSQAILGEAQLGGPVILAWDAALQDCRHPETGHNVVYHEFAHKLDMLTGQADGTPPLNSAEEYRQWTDVCSHVFLDLRARAKAGRKTFLDSYGATNEAEFFAVATEEFFGKPSSLKQHHPDLYEVLSKFYRQDPASLEELQA